MSRGPDAAAASLLEAHRTGVACAPVRTLLDDHDAATGYRIQQLVAERWPGRRRRVVGRKIGLTSAAVQRQLGVDQPDYGSLYDDMGVPDGGEVPTGRLLQPKAEAEVAFTLERDLVHERHTAADVIAATAFVTAAIEVVDSRIAGWDITLVDTLADNASSGMFVLGTSPRRLDAVDLPAAAMVLARNGEVVSEGAGRACLGGPVNAVVWLADSMVAAGTPLCAGDVVLSGALGPMADARAGDVFEASIDGFGAARVAFGR